MIPKIENRQKLATALLLPSLGLIAYAFSSAAKYPSEVETISRRIDELALSSARLRRGLSTVGETTDILERSIERLDDPLSAPTSRNFQLTQVQMDAWRVTISSNRAAARLDDGRLDQFLDTERYPYLSQVAFSLRQSLRHEDQVWMALQVFLELHADPESSEADREAAFQKYLNALLDVGRDAAAHGAVLKKIQEELLSLAYELTLDSNDMTAKNRRIHYSHFLILGLLMFGILATGLCACEILGFRLQRKE